MTKLSKYILGVGIILIIGVVLIETNQAKTVHSSTNSSNASAVSISNTQPEAKTTQPLANLSTPQSLIKNAQTKKDNLAVAGFYPVVSPNSYFISPGGVVNFHGVKYMPGEQVVVTGNGKTISLAADESGSFTTQNFAVGNTGGNQTYTFTGLASHTSYKVTIHVATWNPYLLLDNYYNVAGSKITITGHQFGENETVSINFDTQIMLTTTTDASGNFTQDIVVPNASLGSHIVSAQGLATKKTATTKFTIGQ